MTFKKVNVAVVFGYILLNINLAFAQIPSGYYNAATGLSGSSLQVALYNIVKNHTVISYDGLWNAYSSTDVKANGKLWDIYSTCIFTLPTHQDDGTLGTAECQKYNREHSMPQSYFGTASPMVSDLFHVYPTDKKVNSVRADYPYGEVNTATYTSSNGCKLGNSALAGFTGIVFEPVDSFKGDIARTYFYMAIRYSNIIASWAGNGSSNGDVLDGSSYPAFDAWFITMLLQWNALDPVSPKEEARNNTIYSNYQHNRNPFIDHPEFANLVWNQYAPYSTEPSNHAANFSAHNIILNWIDAIGGTAPTGYLVRMSSIGFSSIANPIDGTPITDDANNKNIALGIQTCFFSNLTPNTTYYFKIFGYIGSGASINYKTDGSVQQVSMMAK